MMFTYMCNNASDKGINQYKNIEPISLKCDLLFDLLLDNLAFFSRNKCLKLVTFLPTD